MADKKSILIRLSPDLVDELSRWAKDDLRSLNSQIEFVLRQAVQWQRKALRGNLHEAVDMVRELVDETVKERKEKKREGE